MISAAKNNATYAGFESVPAARVHVAHPLPLSWRAVCPPSMAPHAPMVEIASAAATATDATEGAKHA